MGTNFYAEVDDRSLHLGKRSAGWKFAFRAHDEFNSVRRLVGWLENTPGVRIFDEYGKEHDPVEWVRMARTWCPDGHRVVLPCCGDEYHHGPDMQWARTTHFADHEGHEWCSIEFC
jgi:hypothetical protein